MFDTVLGLPVHILVIHIVVVIGPLAALLAIGYAARPAWRPALRWPLVAAAIATGVFGFIAGESGEALERRVKVTRAGDSAALALVHDHTQAGDLTKAVCMAFMILVLIAVFVLLPARGAPRGGAVLGLVTAVVLSAAAVGTIASITITGHSGVTAAWAAQVTGPAPAGGDDHGG